MSRTFNIHTDPYCEREMYAKSTVTIEPGLTVLVGCNGAGKTTLRVMLEEQLDLAGIPYLSHNNLVHGGNNAMQKALDFNQIVLLAELATSSEGEQISKNVSEFARDMGAFASKHSDTKELWFFFDAIDSGLSIDNIIELKDDLFKMVIEHEKNNGRDVYIIVTANSYELARRENCFDVQNCEYVKFADYEAYRDFILGSLKKKQKQLKASSKTEKERRRSLEAKRRRNN